LTTEVAEVGSFAAAKVHNLVRADIMWNDLQMVERAVNEQYVTVDFRLNYGDDITLRPRFAFLVTEPADTESAARTFSEVKATGLPLKKSEVYERIGYTEPAEGDDVI
jgi:phage gp29-like protein